MGISEGIGIILTIVSVTICKNIKIVKPEWQNKELQTVKQIVILRNIEYLAALSCERMIPYTF